LVAAPAFDLTHGACNAIRRGLRERHPLNACRGTVGLFGHRGTSLGDFFV